MQRNWPIFAEGVTGPFSSQSSLIDVEQMIAAYFNSSTIGFCVLDAGLRFLAINETLAGMNGRPASDHLGKTVRETLGSFADIFEPKLKSVLLTGEPTQVFEVEALIPPSKEPRRAINHYFPVKDAKGTVLRIAAVVIDVTEQRAGQQELRDANEKLGTEAKRLRMMIDVNHLISSNWDLTQVFPRISARIRRVLRQEYAGLALQDEGSGLLVRHSIDFPLGKGFTPDTHIASGGPSGHVFQARAATIFSREELMGFGDEAKSFMAEGLQSVCCVPMLRPSGPLGVFILGSTRKDAFQRDDLQLLEQVAAQLALAIENRRVASEVEALKQRVGEEKKYLEGELRAAEDFGEIVGESPALKHLLDQASTVAGSDATVLILGETGTGKELIARAIHQQSSRKNGPFIKVNCAAIPTGLLESELFGHEKGAFTGAVSQKIGRMELADGGTLFLDEVGEIPLEIQPKLLRVLQDHEFERLGGTRTIRVSLRLVTATNRDLAESVRRHEFRSDLFYRLSVFPIRMPALRERREDIPLLVRHFVRKFALRMGRHLETIPKATMSSLVNWYWPGNVRELENLMERSVILSEGRTLRVPVSELRRHADLETEPVDHTLDTAERGHIIQVLRKTGGVLSGPHGAAKRLGLKRTTLQSKMQRLKINRKDYLDPPH